MKKYFNWLRKKCTCKDKNEEEQRGQKWAQTLFNECPDQTLNEY